MTKIDSQSISFISPLTRSYIADMNRTLKLTLTLTLLGVLLLAVPVAANAMSDTETNTSNGYYVWVQVQGTVNGQNVTAYSYHYQGYNVSTSSGNGDCLSYRATYEVSGVWYDWYSPATQYIWLSTFLSIYVSSNPPSPPTAREIVGYGESGYWTGSAENPTYDWESGLTSASIPAN